MTKEAMKEHLGSDTWRHCEIYMPPEQVICLGERFTCVIGHSADVFSNDFFDRKYWSRI